MRCIHAILMLGLLCGCSSRKQSELLEARLREQEARLLQLSEKLEQTESELELAEREKNDLRSQLSGSGKTYLRPEQSDVFYRLADIQLDSLQTAVIPASGDSTATLNVLLTPTDQYGEALKYPVETTFSLMRGEKLIEKFEVSSKEMAPQWTSGWITSGYALQLDLSVQPPEGPLQLKVDCLTVDGRKFSDEVTLNREDETASRIQPISAEAPLKPDSKESSKKSVPIPTDLPDVTPAEPDIMPPNDDDLQPPPREKDPERIETSDRRTIDEYPVYR